MQTTVEQTGKRPFQFDGELIADATPNVNLEDKFCRFVTVKIWKVGTDNSGPFAAQVSYHCPGTKLTDSPHHSAKICADAEEVIRFFAESDPSALVSSIDSGVPNAARKTAEIKQRIDSMYQSMIGQAMAQAAIKCDGFATVVSQ